MDTISRKSLDCRPYQVIVTLVFMVLTGFWLNVSGDDVIQQPWTFESGVRLNLFYDDNVRLTVDNPQSSPGGLAEVYGLVAKRTEVTDLSLRATVDSRYYNDISELNRTDGSLDFSYVQRMSRFRFGLASSFDYDSTRTSEELTSGITQVNKRRISLGIIPSIGFDISERARLDADYAFLDVSYEDVNQIPLSNYSHLI